MRRLSAVLLVAAAVAGCKKSEAPAAAPVAPPPAAAEAAAPAAPQGVSIKGKVLERLDAPPYTYLKIATGKEEQWTAVPETKLAKGAEASVVGAMPMQGFESKTLNRKFDVVYFGTLEGAAAPAPTAAAPAMGGADTSPAGMAAQHANVAKGPADVGDVKVDKASGADARTVAEVYAQKAQLKDKPVTIRGKVVKYNAGIMGKNWLHLRDGSGKADKDNDLTITSQDVAKVGDVVIVKGAVRTDKDFGAGYAYPVIVEDAKISK
ncbi:MAG: nucleotide-binding protein [Anaeromyxobacter sp.]|nr:nucleotide-binding protein [Anaeromyxobacter sp.]MBL0276354.1 nucleotide-binding protein [Anaeromyxobacter sp.]